MEVFEAKYWQEGIDSKALLVCFLRKLPYLLLMGVAGAVLGSGLYLLITVLTSGGTIYQAETEYYIEFAEGRIDAKDYYNDFTWNTVMATDWILGNTMEILGSGYDRNEIGNMITADILSDVRYLTITVRGADAELVDIVSEATKLSLESLVNRVEKIDEIDSIVQIKSNGVEQIKEPLFTWRAAFLGAVFGILTGAFGMVSVFTIGGRYYTKEGLSRSLGIPVYGLLYGMSGNKSEADGMQEKVLGLALQHCMEKTCGKKLVLMDVGESGSAQRCKELLTSVCKEELADVEISVQNSDIVSKDNYNEIRQTNGVILAIPFGKSCREAAKDKILQLENQDCKVLGAILVEVDRKWMRLYGVH